jgi:hypothetical protein
MVQRLIAQGVLLAMLTGMFTPLAAAAAMPHACCLRHQRQCHMPHDAGISSRNCCHQCCRLLAVSTALFAPMAPRGLGNLPASQLISSSRLAFRPFHVLAERTERAPPPAN